MLLNWILNILFLLTLLTIFKQDFKDRLVYWWLFPLAGILAGFIHFTTTNTYQFLIAITINIGLVVVIIGILFFYSKIVLKNSFNQSFGLGDALFFLVLAISFPTATFLVLFSFSLLFAALGYLLIKSKTNYKTVPLAGFQSLFISIILIISWLFKSIELYLI